MTEAMNTLEGWYTLHDFRSVDWARWQSLSVAEKNAVSEELFTLFKKWSSVENNKLGSFGLFEITGQKADFLFLNLRVSLEELTELEREFNKTRFAGFTEPAHSYVSVVELSNYVVNHDKNLDADPRVQARLKPILPAMKNVCFYPMNKRREPGENWYWQPMEERQRMMLSHGMLGRKYAGRIVQMIGGSMGFDDWEWGVTLFADDPVTFKKIVQEMRFDEVSARFGEFGYFFVGTKLTAEQMLATL